MATITNNPYTTTALNTMSVKASLKTNSIKGTITISNINGFTNSGSGDGYTYEYGCLGYFDKEATLAIYESYYGLSIKDYPDLENMITATGSISSTLPSSIEIATVSANYSRSSYTTSSRGMQSVNIGIKPAASYSGKTLKLIYNSVTYTDTISSTGSWSHDVWLDNNGQADNTTIYDAFVSGATLTFTIEII